MTRLLALCLAALLAALPARAADPAAARATAEALVEGAHGALTDPGLSQAERDARLKTAVEAGFAFDIWEKFLLGDRAAELSEAETARFRALLPGFLAHLYSRQFGKGLDRKPEIEDTRPVRTDMLVRAQIPRAGGKSLPVDWRVRDLGDQGHRVIDVMVGGTSFLITKRAEFGALLDAGGAAALLDHMAANSL